MAEQAQSSDDPVSDIITEPITGHEIEATRRVVEVETTPQTSSCAYIQAAVEEEHHLVGQENKGLDESSDSSFENNFTLLFLKKTLEDLCIYEHHLLDEFLKVNNALTPRDQEIVLANEIWLIRNRQTVLPEPESVQMSNESPRDAVVKDTPVAEPIDTDPLSVERKCVALTIAFARDISTMSGAAIPGENIYQEVSAAGEELVRDMHHRSLAFIKQFMKPILNPNETTARDKKCGETSKEDENLSIENKNDSCHVDGNESEEKDASDAEKAAVSTSSNVEKHAAKVSRHHPSCSSESSDSEKESTSPPKVCSHTKKTEVKRAVYKKRRHSTNSETSDSDASVSKRNAARKQAAKRSRLITSSISPQRHRSESTSSSAKKQAASQKSRHAPSCESDSDSSSEKICSHYTKKEKKSKTRSQPEKHDQREDDNAALSSIKPAIQMVAPTTYDAQKSIIEQKKQGEDHALNKPTTGDQKETKGDARAEEPRNKKREEPHEVVVPPIRHHTSENSVSSSNRSNRTSVDIGSASQESQSSRTNASTLGEGKKAESVPAKKNEPSLALPSAPNTKFSSGIFPNPNFSSGIFPNPKFSSGIFPNPTFSSGIFPNPIFPNVPIAGGNLQKHYALQLPPDIKKKIEQLRNSFTKKEVPHQHQIPTAPSAPITDTAPCTGPSRSTSGVRTTEQGLIASLVPKKTTSEDVPHDAITVTGKTGKNHQIVATTTGDRKRKEDSLKDENKKKDGLNEVVVPSITKPPPSSDKSSTNRPNQPTIDDRLALFNSQAGKVKDTSESSDHSFSSNGNSKPAPQSAVTSKPDSKPIDSESKQKEKAGDIPKCNKQKTERKRIRLLAKPPAEAVVHELSSSLKPSIYKIPKAAPKPEVKAPEPPPIVEPSDDSKDRVSSEKSRTDDSPRRERSSRSQNSPVRRRKHYHSGSTDKSHASDSPRERKRASDASPSDRKRQTSEHSDSKYGRSSGSCRSRTRDSRDRSKTSTSREVKEIRTSSRKSEGPSVHLPTSPNWDRSTGSRSNTTSSKDRPTKEASSKQDDSKPPSEKKRKIESPTSKEEGHSSTSQKANSSPVTHPSVFTGRNKSEQEKRMASLSKAFKPIDTETAGDEKKKEAVPSDDHQRSNFSPTSNVPSSVTLNQQFVSFSLSKPTKLKAPVFDILGQIEKANNIDLSAVVLKKPDMTAPSRGFGSVKSSEPPATEQEPVIAAKIMKAREKIIELHHHMFQSTADEQEHPTEEVPKDLLGGSDYDESDEDDEDDEMGPKSRIMKRRDPPVREPPKKYDFKIPTTRRKITSFSGSRSGESRSSSPRVPAKKPKIVEELEDGELVSSGDDEKKDKIVDAPIASNPEVHSSESPIQKIKVNEKEETLVPGAALENVSSDSVSAHVSSAPSSPINTLKETSFSPPRSSSDPTLQLEVDKANKNGRLNGIDHTVDGANAVIDAVQLKNHEKDDNSQEAEKPTNKMVFAPSPENRQLGCKLDSLSEHMSSAPTSPPFVLTSSKASPQLEVNKANRNGRSNVNEHMLDGANVVTDGVRSENNEKGYEPIFEYVPTSPPSPAFTCGYSPVLSDYEMSPGRLLLRNSERSEGPQKAQRTRSKASIELNLRRAQFGLDLSDTSSDEEEDGKDEETGERIIEAEKQVNPTERGLHKMIDNEFGISADKDSSDDNSDSDSSDGDDEEDEDENQMQRQKKRVCRSRSKRPRAWNESSSSCAGSTSDEESASDESDGEDNNVGRNTPTDEHASPTDTISSIEIGRETDSSLDEFGAVKDGQLEKEFYTENNTEEVESDTQTVTNEEQRLTPEHRVSDSKSRATKQQLLAELYLSDSDENPSAEDSDDEDRRPAGEERGENAKDTPKDAQQDHECETTQQETKHSDPKPTSIMQTGEHWQPTRGEKFLQDPSMPRLVFKNDQQHENMQLEAAFKTNTKATQNLVNQKVPVQKPQDGLAQRSERSPRSSVQKSPGPVMAFKNPKEKWIEESTVFIQMLMQDKYLEDFNNFLNGIVKQLMEGRFKQREAFKTTFLQIVNEHTSAIPSETLAKVKGKILLFSVLPHCIDYQEAKKEEINMKLVSFRKRVDQESQSMKESYYRSKY